MIKKIYRRRVCRRCQEWFRASGKAHVICEFCDGRNGKKGGKQRKQGVK